MPQTTASAPRRAAIKFAKIRLPEALRPTATSQPKAVPTAPALIPSKPVGPVIKVIINPEALVLRTVPVPVTTPIREVCRQMLPLPQKAVPTAPVLTQSKPVGPASPVIQSQETAVWPAVKSEIYYIPMRPVLHLKCQARQPSVLLPI